MLKYYYSGWRWTTLPSPPLLPACSNGKSSVLHRTRDHHLNASTYFSSSGRFLCTRCGARRRVRFNDEDEDEEKEEYGHNAGIAMLEMYSQSARDEALLVKALLDDQEAEVLIFKGFSSCLSYGTSPDPSRSVLPARAVITSIDRIRGPFDPSNIEYLEKEITWETFKSRLLPN